MSAVKRFLSLVEKEIRLFAISIMIDRLFLLLLLLFDEIGVTECENRSFNLSTSFYSSEWTPSPIKISRRILRKTDENWEINIRGKYHYHYCVILSLQVWSILKNRYAHFCGKWERKKRDFEYDESQKRINKVEVWISVSATNNGFCFKIKKNFSSFLRFMKYENFIDGSVYIYRTEVVVLLLAFFFILKFYLN